MDGEAIKWITYHNADQQPFLTWYNFYSHLSEHFDDHHTTFSRVKQYTSVDACIKDFENLANQTQGFITLFKLQTFPNSLIYNRGNGVHSSKPGLLKQKAFMDA